MSNKRAKWYTSKRSIPKVVKAAQSLRAIRENGLTAFDAAVFNTEFGKYPIADDQLLKLNQTAREIYNQSMLSTLETINSHTRALNTLKKEMKDINPHHLLQAAKIQETSELSQEKKYYLLHCRQCPLFLRELRIPPHPRKDFDRYDQDPPLREVSDVAFWLNLLLVDPLSFTSWRQSILNFLQLSRLIGMRIFHHISTLMKRVKKMVFVPRSEVK